MRIGFFGGSFDPPHRGHLAVATAAADAYALDRVLLAPTALQPLKLQGSAASFHDRLAMVALLCKADPRLEPSTLDAPRFETARADATPNYTVDTLTGLRESLQPDDALFVLVGADAFREIGRWHQPQRLLTLSDWIVVSRPDIPPVMPAEARDARRDGRVHSLNTVHDDANATELRARLEYGLPCDDWIPAPVLGYIHLHHLYRRSKPSLRSA